MASSVRVALVTGGGKRIGRAIVERLAEAGFDIAFTYLHSADGAAEVVGALEKAGRQALAINADLSHPETVEKEVARVALDRFGRVDVLVNSASIYEPTPLQSVTLDRLRILMAIHCETPLMLCHALGPSLKANHGHMVNILDVIVSRPWPEYLGYCASKAALWNLTLGLAAELAPDVTVNGIAPSVVQWPEQASERYRERYLSRIPLARPGQPADVANAVHYLCTAGSYITGQILHVDGGYSIT